jgi:putative spermidine/putrescine transport system permease protein
MMRKWNLTRKGIPLPIAPFALLFGFFFLYPILKVVHLSFLSNEGSFTLSNYATVFTFPYNQGLIGSIKLGLYSAVIAAIPGAIIAYFVDAQASERFKRFLAALNGVIANTGGIPLAFMFTAAIGRGGIVTKILNYFGIDIYAGSFSLGTFNGILIVYLYFQIPLMVIVFAPAIGVLRAELKDAAISLGATSRQYWQKVAVPLLAPSFIACLLLLFASGFSAYATANALTVGNVLLTPLQIAGLLNGNVSASQLNLGKALAAMMIVVSGLAIIPYLIIQKRVAKWRN